MRTIGRLSKEIESLLQECEDHLVYHHGSDAHFIERYYERRIERLEWQIGFLRGRFRRAVVSALRRLTRKCNFGCALALRVPR